MLASSRVNPADLADACTLPIAWFAFVFLWICNAFLWAMFVAWTPLVTEGWRVLPAHTGCVWIFLAIGVVVSAAACSVAWVFVLADPIGYKVPRCPTSRSSGRAAEERG